MALYILNSIFIASIGIIALFRWRHLRWFPVYALTISILPLFNLIFPWLYTHELSLIRINIGELLCLLAYVEVMRKEVGHEPWWAIFALLALVVVPFFPLPLVLLYYLPMSIFNLGQALEMPNAIKKKSALILAWSISGSSYFVSDILKMTVSSRQIWDVLIFLDPFFFTAMCSVMLVGQLWPEVEKVWGFLSRAVGGWRREGLAASAKVDAAVVSEGALPEEGAVMPFPIEKMQIGSLEGPADRIEMEDVLEKIDAGFDTLKDSLKKVAALSFRMKKVFISSSDLALYLGVSEAAARQFVERNEIDKIQISDDSEEWVVLRADIDDILEDDRE